MIHRIGQDTLELKAPGCLPRPQPEEKRKPKGLWETILTRPILTTPWGRTVGKKQKLFYKKRRWSWHWEKQHFQPNPLISFWLETC